MAVVSVTTRIRTSETLVVLQPGDHPFIRHESVIGYRYSDIMTLTKIENIIATGRAKRREPITEALLGRIRAGLLESDFTPNGVRQFVKAVLAD